MCMCDVITISPCAKSNDIIKALSLIYLNLVAGVITYTGGMAVDCLPLANLRSIDHVGHLDQRRRKEGGWVGC